MGIGSFFDQVFDDLNKRYKSMTPSEIRRDMITITRFLEPSIVDKYVSRGLATKYNNGTTRFTKSAINALSDAEFEELEKEMR